MKKITLAAARINAGLTQKEAAERLNVTPKTLGKWERAETFPDARHIDAICNLYAVSYEQIIFLPQETA